MSRLSIYETSWIDIVFEDRNKNYGAYQLRQNSVKSSIIALFMGLIFVTSIAGITAIVRDFNPDTAPIVTNLPDTVDRIIQLTNVSTPKNNTTAHPQIKSKITEVPITKDVLINPVIVKPIDANDNIATNVEIKSTVTETTEGTGVIGVNPSSGNGTGTEPSKAVDYGTSIVNTTLLDKLPEFPGGMKKFYSYVGNNFEKPEIDGMNSLKVYMSFVIEKDGSMSSIKVLRDPGFGLGQEATRVLKSLKTKWTPGIIDSKPVRTAYNLPISIEMR